MSNRIQQWFETIVRGLAAQDWQLAAGPKGQCLYRAPNGRKCAIGQLIPDDAFVIKTGAGVWSLDYTGKLSDLGLGDISDSEEIDFLIIAQKAHDSAHDDNAMKDHFRDVAKFYKLTFPSDVPQ